MYLKNYITGCALTCPSLFTENTDEWRSCNSVLDITFKEGLPYVQQYRLKNEVLRAETGHPSTAYQPTPVLWKKWSSIGRVKTSIMGTLPKHFLISLRTQPAAESQAPPTHLLCQYSSCLFQKPLPDRYPHSVEELGP